MKDFLNIQLAEQIGNPNGATKAELLEILENAGAGSSEKTLERKIRALRDFGLEINYQRSLNRYVMVQGQDMRNFNAMTISLIMSNFYNRATEIPDFIDFGILPSQRSVSKIEAVSKALKSKQVLVFSYQKFYESTNRSYRVKPVFIRFWNNRWYLIAVKTESGELRNFGLDRINEIRVDREVFDDDFSAIRLKYEQFIGISGFENPVEEITLVTNEHGGNLFKSLKLHSSQTTIKLADDLYRVNMRVVVNRELIEILATIHQPFQIISPESLKVGFRNHLSHLESTLRA